MGTPSEGLPTRTRIRSTRDFSADAAQDAVILSVEDLAAAQQAVTLARQDQEDERRAGTAAGARDSPEPGSGPAGPGTPAAGNPPSRAAGRPRSRSGTPARCSPGRVPAPGAAHPGPARRPPAPPPSWGRVLLTTVQLWAQRRLHLRWPAQARWRVLTVVVVAAVLVGAGVISVALTRSSPAPAAARPGAHVRTGQAPARRPSRRPRRPGQRGPAGSPGRCPRTRSCPATRRCARCCRPRGSRRARLLALGGSNPAPLGSDLIVSTAAVRSEFGARLGSVYAPAMLASFGTGGAQTAVRVVAADGGPAYLRSLRADVAARVSAGRQLLQNPRLRPSARPAGPWPPARPIPGC